jgi:LmbE family N-acetylglucosaminyl deacetylase
LIQAALARGINVHVVVVTNGDGQEIAPAALGMGVIPNTADFVAIGKRRQAESIAALEKLGLTAIDVSFLSYPDRGVKPMWMANWNVDCPYYSTYTKTTHSPYPNTFNPQATYCGWDVLHDLQAIIAAQKPDLLVLPHPDDQHPDHLAVSNFTRLAVALESISDVTYHPTLLGYLVHYGYFPEPRGHHPAKPLLPPVPLAGVDYTWVLYDLTPQEELTKIAAVGSYSSQIHLMEDFLVSFDRPDEPFMQLSLNSLPLLATRSIPAPVSTGGGLNFYEPSRETPRLLAAPGADIIGWQITRQGDTLLLTMKTSGSLSNDVQYTTYIKTPDGVTHKYPFTGTNESHTSNAFTTQVSLADLGNPPVLAFSAETRKDVVLDTSAWEFILLGNPTSATSTPVR